MQPADAGMNVKWQLKSEKPSSKQKVGCFITGIKNDINRCLVSRWVTSFTVFTFVEHPHCQQVRVGSR
jgi:hypothetical protein